MGDKRYELTLVVPMRFTTKEIEKIDEQIGEKHDRHYAYGAHRDVVYYVDDDRADAVCKILNKIKGVKAYNLNEHWKQDTK